MARSKNTIPLMKIVATTIGAALCCLDSWLNAEFIAHSDGWASSMVYVVIATTLGAAAALPFAERSAKAGQKGKAFGLALFFAIMVGFSICASVDRLGSRKDNETASARSGNLQAKLAQEGYDAAKKAAEAECTKVRGTRCRKAEDAENKAREALSSKPAERVEDSMAVRIAAALPFLTVANVELYQPLMLPLGLQLGGFLMLALGLSPKERIEPKPKARRKPRKKAAVKPKKLGNVVDFQTTAKRATK